MAGCRREWSTDKLKYLEANYESCKLKVRQDSLHCKLFILEYQNRLEEEKRITLKYELKATRQQLKQAEVGEMLVILNIRTFYSCHWKTSLNSICSGNIYIYIKHSYDQLGHSSDYLHHLLTFSKGREFLNL